MRDCADWSTKNEESCVGSGIGGFMKVAISNTLPGSGISDDGSELASGTYISWILVFCLGIQVSSLVSHILSTNTKLSTHYLVLSA